MANKEAAVAELTEYFRSSSAIVLTEYRGLSVTQLKTLRRGIQADATYAVVKNTLTRIAAKEQHRCIRWLTRWPSALLHHAMP